MCVYVCVYVSLYVRMCVCVCRVYVDSNMFVIRRTGGWDDDAVAAVSEVIEEFFLFYPDAA